MQKLLGPNKVNFTMSAIQSGITGHAKKKKSTTYNEKKNPSNLT